MAQKNRDEHFPPFNGVIMLPGILTSNCKAIRNNLCVLVLLLFG